MFLVGWHGSRVDIYAYSLLLFLFILPTFVFGLSKNFEENARKYGNKSANLIELKVIVQELNAQNKTEKKFVVPALFTGSHQDVVEFLDNTFKEEWQQFVTAQRGKGSTLISTAAESLKKIRMAILAAYKPAEENLGFVTNDIRGEEERNELEKFLKDAGRKNDLLMVRSTGREDSKELANAGGNESISSVRPIMGEISEAMGVVVASYFSEKSIGQRLALNDSELFNAPFMPVLLQVMVGEVVGGAKQIEGIPVSGVMFSQEAEGHTPGVTQIQATYGHNEAVVNGLVPVDTFYIDQTSMVIHPVIRIKTNRLITKLNPRTNRNELMLHKNTAQSAKKPSLDVETIRALKFAATYIEQYYLMPVDIEFVILKDTIYLVQSRPIVPQKMFPSYIKTEYLDQVSTENKLEVQAIGVGDGAVRVVTSRDQLIVSDNIRNALALFLKEKNKDAIQAVIVGQMAPATSHEATNFRGNGKPVLYLKDMSTLQMWLRESQLTLLIDPQQELLLIFKQTKEFSSAEAVQEKGWITHPIPMITSFISSTIRLLKQYFGRLAPEEFFGKEVTRSQLLDKVKKADINEAVKALRSMQMRLFDMVKQKQKEGAIDPLFVKKLQFLALHAQTFTQEIYLALLAWERSDKGEQARLSRLYPVKFLEALVKQVPKPLEIIDQYSIRSLLKTEKIEQRLKEELKLEPTEKALEEYIIQYAKATDYALTEDLKNQWQGFLRSYATIENRSLDEYFAQMMYQLSRLKLMSLWLNLSFAQVAKEISGANERAQRLTAEYKKSEQFITQLAEKKQLLASIDMSGWEDPDKFEKQWDFFNKEILDYFVRNAFAAQFTKADMLGRNASVIVLKDLVTTFDHSIKAVEASQGKYRDESVLVTRLKTMVQSYFDLFRKLLSFPLIKEDVKSYFRDISQEKYLNLLDKKLNQVPLTIDQLNPKSGFNVSSFIVGTSYKGGKIPQDEFSSALESITLESIFSVTHQNLLNVLRLLGIKSGALDIPVPEFARELKSTLEKRLEEAIKFIFREGFFSIIGVELTKDTITYYYNVPLFNHGISLELQVDSTQKTAQLTLKVVGPGQRRFAIMTTYAMLSLSPVVYIKEKPQYTENEFSVTWDISRLDAISIHDAATYLEQMIILTDKALNGIVDSDMMSTAPSFTQERIINAFIQRNDLSVSEKQERAKQVVAYINEHPSILRENWNTWKLFLFELVVQLVESNLVSIHDYPAHNPS